jgi:hypothetical protein
MDTNLKKVKITEVRSKLKSSKSSIRINEEDNSIQIQSFSDITENNYNIAIGIIDPNIIDSINIITPKREWKILIKAGTSGTSGTSGA